MKSGIRDLIAAIAPPWLQRNGAGASVGAKLLYVMGLSGDKAIEKLDQAVRARMPGLGDPSALPLIGADRVMPQGPSEPAASYAVRLQDAFETWQRAGSAWSILRQLYGYFSPLLPRLDDWSNTGARDELAAGSDPTQPPVHTAPGTWNWDGIASYWWRAWTIIFAPSTTPAICTGEGTWGDGDLWGDTTKSWGLSLPSTTWASVRAIIKTWKPANIFHVWTIVSLDNTLFNPASPGTMPDGTWGRWSKTVAGVRVPSRAANARYTDGVI